MVYLNQIKFKPIFTPKKFNIMHLILGETYTVLKNDQTTITFKFTDGEPPSCEVNGEVKLLSDVLKGGWQAYWVSKNII